MKTLLMIGGIIVVGAVIAASHHSSSSSASATASSSASEAAISVVEAKSFCLYSGIDDVYTGDGQVVFGVTLRNTGDSAGTVSVTPVRHYDDGELNNSAMDMLTDITVPAHGTKAIRSPLYTYKAHQHEIESCGVQLGTGDEVPVSASQA